MLFNCLEALSNRIEQAILQAAAPISEKLVVDGENKVKFQIAI